MKTHLSLSIEATPSALPSSREWLRKCFTEDLGLGWNDACRQLATALTEAVANAIVHGGRYPIGRDSSGHINPHPVPSRDHVRIELHYCPAGVVAVSVADAGEGFTPRVNRMPGTDSDHGRGLAIMEDCCDRLECFARNNWWVVRMVKCFS